MTEIQRAAREEPPAPASKALAWVGWHLVEITGVTVPGALAASVSGWFGVLAAAAGAGWVAHEVRLSRKHTAIRQAATGARPALTGDGTATTSNDSDTQQVEQADVQESVPNEEVRRGELA